jgi:hypothetical protein
MLQLREPEWTSENASELETFLRTRTGQAMLAKIAFNRPAFKSSDAHPHKSFANSREIHGYEQAVKTLLSLTEAEEQPLSQSQSVGQNLYPDLDDDAQWQTPEK